MRSLITVLALLVCSSAFAQRSTPPRDLRSGGSIAMMHLDSAMSSLAAADESLGAMQQMLERDAEVLAKLRDARSVLEEDTQPMTVVNAAAVRVREAHQFRPHRNVSRALEPVDALLVQFRQSSANIDLPQLTARMDDAVNAASDVVVEDVRLMQPTLAVITRMQEALQVRLSGLVQSQGLAMAKTARTRH